MSSKKPGKKATTKSAIIERDGTVTFAGPDGTLYIYATQDGGFFLHTRYAGDDGHSGGVSITNHELTNLAAALTRLAQNDERTP